VRNRYAERVTAAWLAGVAVCTWTREVAEGAAQYRVVPDGCTDLIWNGTVLFVAGPDTEVHLSEAGQGRLAGVRFGPGIAPAVFGVPAGALTDERPALGDISPHLATLATQATDRLNDSADPELVLQRAVGAVVRREQLDPALPGLLAGIRRGATVGELADDLGIGERSLHRRCVTALGYGPKVAQRVLRFHRALGLARSGRAFAEVAAVTGYADQAHLSREVRALAGVPLTDLLGPTT
jgi:AraC-like DNA-binding protein